MDQKTQHSKDIISLSRLISRLNAIPIKIPTRFFIDKTSF